MTAEIAILNRQAIVLAADSAITIGKERVWEYANKIFSLGPRYDIGIMIYNSGDFIGVPWEIIIKLFKKTLSKEARTLNDVVIEFTAFLRSDSVHNETSEELSFCLIFTDSISRISKDIEYKTKSEMISLAQAKIADALSEMDAIESFDNEIDFKSFSRMYSRVITEMCNESFRFRVDTKTKNMFVELCYTHIIKHISSEYFTGVVFAGFGKEELFPCITHLVVDGKANGFARVW